MPGYTGNCGTVTTSQASGTFFPVGTTTVTVTGLRLDGTSDTCTFNVTVNDTEAPEVSAATVDRSLLWPANHQMEMVTVNYTATDNCSVNCVLTVTSNEPSDGLGDGDFSPDWEVVDAHHVLLRAERSGSGTGRLYTITVTCTDSGGHIVVRTVTVRVPRSMGKRGPSI
jgi:HYR domain